MARKFTENEIINLIETNRLDIFYNSRFWRALCCQIKKEQHYECQICKAKGRVKNADVVHHVRHLKKHPQLAYSRYFIDDNGIKQKQLIALCHLCHDTEHGRVFKGNTKSRKGYTNEEKY